MDPRSVLIVFVLFCVLGTSSRAQTTNAFTEPAGFCTVNLLSNSDTRVSIPFARFPAFVGAIKSLTNNTVVVQGNPNWSPNQFVYAVGAQSNTYSLLIASGAREGQRFPITNNTADTVSIDLSVTNLTGVTAEDRVRIVPHWTLATAFPNSGIIETTNLLHRATEVLAFDPVPPGTNLSAAVTYYFYQGHWRRVGEPLDAVSDDVVLSSTAHVIVRHNDPVTTSLIPSGIPPPQKHLIPLLTQVASKQDNAIALERPTMVTLNQSGLIDNGAFVTSGSPSELKDELLVFDNAVEGRNKAPIASYFYYNGAWRQRGLAPDVDVGETQVFVPGTGVVVRKNADAGGTTALWINTPNY